MIHFNQATFTKSVAKLSQLPTDEGAEIVFAGRSNAGKSSALNTLTNQKKLARTSKTPGRTQLINFFELSKDYRLVDLPGYGYAKVPASMKKEWIKLIDGYLQTRQSICGIVLLMDIRHPLQPFDQQMIEWTDQLQIPLHILLTKADKFKHGAQKNTLLSVQRDIRAYSLVTIQLFSSLKRQGLDELKSQLNHYLTPDHDAAI